MKQIITFPDVWLSFSPAAKQIVDPSLLLAAHDFLFFSPACIAHAGALMPAAPLYRFLSPAIDYEFHAASAWD